MFGMFRIIMRVIENPRLLIAFGVLILFGVFMQYVLFSDFGNPLPDPDDVLKVSFVSGEGGDGSISHEMDMDLYAELRECLDGCNSLIHSGTGELAGTVVIRQTDGRTCQARLYEWGFVQTEDGLFEAAGGTRAKRLASLISRMQR